jgi:voltage-gated potassium channel
MTTTALDASAPPADPDDPSGRLAAYTAHTQTPLDVLSLLTLWIVLVPPSDFGSASTIAWIGRIGLSVIYAIDFTIRISLARRHWRYARTNVLSAFVVIFPPLRVILSLRLIRSVFRRGNLDRFLVVAALLVLNGAAVVYFFERDAHGSNIHTFGESVWWAITTVSTVGYGDYYPVTTGGKIAAGLIMAIAVLTLAVVTAQVAASFMDQRSRRREVSTPVPPDGSEVSLADVMQRLARIEALLADRLSVKPDGESGAPG